METLQLSAWGLPRLRQMEVSPTQRASEAPACLSGEDRQTDTSLRQTQKAMEKGDVWESIAQEGSCLDRTGAFHLCRAN